MVIIHSLAVIMSVDSLSTATSLTISWSLGGGATATIESYSISYSNTNTECFTDSDVITGIAASDTMYTLTDLQEGTEYFVTVIALLHSGKTAKDNLTATITDAG